MIDAALDAFLAPQERFDDMFNGLLPRAGRNACDFAYANAHEGPDAAVVAAIRNVVETQNGINLQYSPYGGSTLTRRLVAERLSADTGLSFDWRDVVLTPGAMSALNVLLRMQRRRPGQDEVVILTPCWIDYPLYVVQQGMKPVLVPLREGTFRLDLERIAAAITPDTRALIFTNPGNPTGVVHSPEEMRALADLLGAARDKTGEAPLLISDECHRDVNFSGRPYASALTHYDSTCMVYSFGKSLFMQGQRIGFAAVSPRMPDRLERRRELVRLVRALGFCHPTAIMQSAVRDLIYHAPDLARLERRRARVIDALRSFGYEVVPGDATFFVYVRSPDPDEFAFTERLARQGVFVLPSSVFHHSGYFRVSITATEAMIDRAIPVFEKNFNERA